jgi:hypothetical protein
MPRMAALQPLRLRLKRQNNDALEYRTQPQRQRSGPKLVQMRGLEQ